MITKVVRWGNGQGIRIPKSILLTMGLDTGDRIDMSVNRGKLIIQKPFRHKTLEERAAEHDGRLVTYEEEADWGEPVGREVW